MQTRRSFIKKSFLGGASVSLTPFALSSLPRPIIRNEELFFKISIAEWSLNRKLFSGELDNLDFPTYAKEKFDIHAVEYVSTFFSSPSKEYVKELLRRTRDNHINNLLIMIDDEGDLGEQNESKRKKAVERHFKWIECAEILGCHAIRVNAAGKGSRKKVASTVVRSLRELCRFSSDFKISILVENHGGYSSDAAWLAAVIEEVEMDNCGTLPDFGNFTINRNKSYDRYRGVKELMPYAKGVSAKSYAFDENGREVSIDYFRLLGIIKESGFRGYIGIEYEGRDLSGDDGIIATKNLLIEAGKSA